MCSCDLYQSNMKDLLQYQDCDKIITMCQTCDPLIHHMHAYPEPVGLFDHAFRAICQIKLMVVQVNTKGVQGSQISGCYILHASIYVHVYDIKFHMEYTKLFICTVYIKVSCKAYHVKVVPCVKEISYAAHFVNVVPSIYECRSILIRVIILCLYHFPHI